MRANYVSAFPKENGVLLTNGIKLSGNTTVADARGGSALIDQLAAAQIRRRVEIVGVEGQRSGARGGRNCCRLEWLGGFFDHRFRLHR